MCNCTCYHGNYHVISFVYNNNVTYMLHIQHITRVAHRLIHSIGNYFTFHKLFFYVAKCLAHTYRPARPGGVCPWGLCGRGSPRCSSGHKRRRAPPCSTSWTEPPLWPNCSFSRAGNSFLTQLEKRERDLRPARCVTETQQDHILTISPKGYLNAAQHPA